MYIKNNSNNTYYLRCGSVGKELFLFNVFRLEASWDYPSHHSTHTQAGTKHTQAGTKHTHTARH